MVWDRRRKYAAYGMELVAILNKMTQEEGDSIPTEFQCSLFDDLTIQAAGIFDRVV
jgi:hypothetical protein